MSSSVSQNRLLCQCYYINGCDFFLLNPRAVFTQATSSHAEARSPRFVVDPRPLPDNCQDGARHWCAATNARRPHQVSGIAYLPNILHKCDRFDLSPRTNGKSKCSETRPMGAGRRQIESVALCVWQRHLRNVSTLSNRTQDEPSVGLRLRFWYTTGQ